MGSWSECMFSAQMRNEILINHRTERTLEITESSPLFSGRKWNHWKGNDLAKVTQQRRLGPGNLQTYNSTMGPAIPPSSWFVGLLYVVPLVKSQDYQVQLMMIGTFTSVLKSEYQNDSWAFSYLHVIENAVHSKSRLPRAVLFKCWLGH